jgi:hypothetical protein
VEELGKKKKKVEGLSVEELEAQRVELLPDRGEMQPTINFYGPVAIGSFAVADQGAQGEFSQVNLFYTSVPPPAP